MFTIATRLVCGFAQFFNFVTVKISDCIFSFEVSEVSPETIELLKTASTKKSTIKSTTVIVQIN